MICKYIVEFEAKKEKDLIEIRINNNLTGEKAVCNYMLYTEENKKLTAEELMGLPIFTQREENQFDAVEFAFQHELNAEHTICDLIDGNFEKQTVLIFAENTKSSKYEYKFLDNTLVF